MFNVTFKEVLPALPVQSQKKVATSLLLYILRNYTAKQYYMTVNMFISKKEARDFKSRALSSFDESMKVKFALLQIGKSRSRYIDKESRYKIYKQFDLNPQIGEDAFNLLRESKKFSKFLMLARSTPVNIESIAVAKNMCWEIVKNLKTFISKFVYKKMRFIVTSNNIEFSEIISHIEENAVYKTYQILPFLTMAHTINTVKRDIHNFGINFIKSHTTQKRGRLKSQKDGYENIIRQLVVSDEDDSNESGYDISQTLINTISCRNLMTIYKDKPRKLQVLRLLMGIEDYDFVDYVNANLVKYGVGRRKRFTDVDSIMNYFSTDIYFDLICGYMMIPRKHFQQFIHQLQSMMDIKTNAEKEQTHVRIQH